MDKPITPARGLRGTVNVPGDKSVSHRALLFSSIADGTSIIRGLSDAADPASTASCIRALGVKMTARDKAVEITGKTLRGWQPPDNTLDAGNSGTTLRLMAGMLAGQSFASTIGGDASLNRRPMKRILDPLRMMGANIGASPQDTAPLSIRGAARLKAITYDLPVASAQVKSCILLAGLYADGDTTVVERVPTRDHTERMLGLKTEQRDGSARIVVHGGSVPKAEEYVIPGDPSAAAYLVAAGILLPGSEVRIEGVGLNPTRTAVFDIWKSVGGSITIEHERVSGGEPLGDLVVRSSSLRGNIDIRGAQVPLVIDEIPILACVALFSEGTFSVRDAKELRAKESDRITLMVQNLRSLGSDVEEYDDGFAFQAKNGLIGATLESGHDHRIAMACAIAGLRLPGVVIRDAECVGISFPGFWNTLQQLSR